ncbi:YbaB/EbfC family nucleoid-associated protein [Kitasatospora aureofaciens]|uniref:Nucleoid-associated protein GCM10010502_14310 n=2 Tax=Kitasatospora aureofaciens TaxID=1894 RepID=A0A8H9LIE3_KITAU|nr:YbaB/EbfC family nucleoid-associated protein [Kitasatospora aureofaciens]QEV00833.1 YbaB/EbfC family nucleoid-associated protein [Streptomyces viridifaciens]ARF79625.1 YbaB/EbfC family nucleoid-associated protein [Kitasatospora aureofaciens]UKZ07146.1 YbaB/EbfC family nucleoid-associated protein [Streptomyces viridifaciens]GGU64684.1 nucleoid-associated protein [Kitasatospora aureofaciens]HJD80891.1 YbaB/EbfC family nucleoid-associated protein [Kitasatospora aureofaciens]
MFPGGGQPNMQQLLKQAQKMQQELAKAQQELAEAKVNGTAGGGLVEATVTGSGELVALTIAPAAVDPEDTETLADLILAAVRDATQAAQKMQAERMGPLTQGMGGGIPGLPF